MQRVLLNSLKTACEGVGARAPHLVAERSNLGAHRTRASTGH